LLSRLAMQRDEIPITTPCGADWTSMTPVEARARLCAACNKVVHDLSAMSEAEVRKVIGGGPVCVRYLYDVHGRVILGGAPEGAKIVPAGALLSKAARSKWLRAAALAASAIVFEACGGNDGAYYRTERLDQNTRDDETSRRTRGAVEAPIDDGFAADAVDADASAPQGDAGAADPVEAEASTRDDTDDDG